MCTVTYLPYQGGFVLTHNRDEAPARSPKSIVQQPADLAGALFFPKDTKAGGSWIVAAANGRTACLLNGAFEPHKHQPPYRRSRGLVMLDFFEWADASMFFQQYDLTGIEPFTFLFFERNRVVEFRWDGSKRFYLNLPDDKPHFWCSASLYPPAMQTRREQVFHHWLKNTASLEPSTVFSLHLTGSVGDPENDYIMNRGGRVCTVSITQVVHQNGQIRMHYSDLLEGLEDNKEVQFSSKDA